MPATPWAPDKRRTQPSWPTDSSTWLPCSARRCPSAPSCFPPSRGRVRQSAKRRRNPVGFAPWLYPVSNAAWSRVAHILTTNILIEYRNVKDARHPPSAEWEDARSSGPTGTEEYGVARALRDKLFLRKL